MPGERVLEFESGDGQAVDKHRHIEGMRGIRAAVAQLAGDAEDIGGEALRRLGVIRRGRAVEQRHLGRAVPDAGAQHIHHAAPGDLALQTAQKPGAFRPCPVEAERLAGIGLGGGEELSRFDPINGMLPLVVPRVPPRVSGLFHKRGNDDRFQAFSLVSVGVIAVSSITRQLDKFNKHNSL